MAAPVTSVCTAVATTNGPGCRRITNAELTPYVKPCFSRRLRFRRDENAPPRMVFITRRGKKSGVLRGTPMCPTRISDWTDPGLSTITTRTPGSRGLATPACAGGGSPSQSPNDLSAASRAASSPMLPATTMAAPFGVNALR